MASQIRLSPIDESNSREIAAFLHRQMRRDWSPDQWLHVVEPHWKSPSANNGFQLLDGEDVVGVYVAYYSKRTIDGETEGICNLGTWCVLPSHRSHSVRLLRALLAQDGYHFTDLSPSPAVVKLNTRLGFRSLETEVFVVPNLPKPPVLEKGSISSEPTTIKRQLAGEDLGHYLDHTAAAGVRHLLLTRESERCYVALRRDKFRGIPVCTVLHISNPDLLAQMSGAFGRHLLLHHGAAIHLIDSQLTPHRPRLARTIARSRRMYRSPTLRPENFDYLYSELACLPN